MSLVFNRDIIRYNYLCSLCLKDCINEVSNLHTLLDFFFLTWQLSVISSITAATGITTATEDGTLSLLMVGRQPLMQGLHKCEGSL